LLQVRVEELQDPAPAVVVSGVFVVEADELHERAEGADGDAAHEAVPAFGCSLTPSVTPSLSSASCRCRALAAG